MPDRLLLILFQVPFAGALAERLFRRPTFYRTDVYHAFEQAIRSIVLEAANILTEHGIRPLTGDEARPILHEFYGDQP